MNKIYRIVFNTTTGRWVVASEMAKGRTKGSSTRVGASLLGLSGLMVVAPSAFASEFFLCNGSNQSLLAVNSTSFNAQNNCGASATGVFLSDTANVGNDPYSTTTSNAYISIGSNIASPTATAAGALTLSGPNGIRLQGPTTFTGLATFQNGVNLFNTKIMSLGAGNLVAGGTDAVNAGQLFSTNQNVSTLQTAVSNINSGGAKYFHIKSIGEDSAATGLESVAIGSNAKAVGDTAVALGYAANAAGQYSIAIGGSAQSGDRSVSIGDGVDTSASTWAVAVGRYAKVTGAYGVALGANASVTGDNAAAIGVSSLADRANSVSVGAADNLRQITNVAKGTAATDAVNVSQLNSLQTTVNNSGIGLVQQTAAGANLTVGKATDGAAVDFTGTAGTRKLTGVSAGTLSATSTDAVNGTQLNTTNQNVTALGGRVTTTEGDIANIKTNVTSVTNSVNSITSGGGVKYFHANSTGVDSAATGTDSVAIGANAKAVGASGIALGLNATTTGANNVTIGGNSKAADKAVSIGDSADTSTQAWAVGLGTNAKVTGTLGTALGAAAQVTGDNSAAVGANSLADRANSVSVGKSGSERQITNVAKGTADTDAANVSQIKGVTTALGGGAGVNADGTIKAPSYTVQGQANIADVGTALGKLDTATTTNTTNIAGVTGRVTTAEGNISSLQTTVNNINSGTAGLVQQDATTRTITVAKGTNGTLVDLTGTAGTRKLTGVSAGTLSATSTDAVNGTQLNATNQNVTTNATNIAALGGRVTTTEGDIANIKTNVTSVTNSVNSITSGGGVKYFHVNSTGADSAATGTDSVAIGANAKAVGASGIALGLNATTTGANNVTIGGNSKAADKSVSIGDGVDTSAQSWAVGLGTNAKVTGTLGVALGAGSQVTGANAAAIGANSIADRANSVSVGSATTQRQVINVAKGTADTDAANVSQLKGVATALGGGAGVNADGTIKAPSYTVQGQANIADVGTALGKLDTATTTNTTNIAGVTGRVTTVEGNVSTLQTTVNNINSGTVGLVQQSAAGANLTVGKATDGAAVDFTGTAGTRKLTGVSAGTLSATSTDAVNGTQLNTTNQNVTTNTTNITALGGRVTTTEGNITNLTNTVNTITSGGGAKYFHSKSTLADSTATGSNSVAVGGAANATGTSAIAVGSSAAATADWTLAAGNAAAAKSSGDIALGASSQADGAGTYSTALGANAQATAKQATAIGAGAKATHAYSVALGQDSTTDRTNSVSVGNATTQRQVTFVAKGTADTDAVNVSQVKGVTTALGGGAGVNTDGTIKAPSYTVQGQANIADVGTALGKLDTATTTNTTNIAGVTGRVTTAEGNISSLQATVNSIGGGTIGLVKQDATTRTVTVAKDTDGTLVDLTGTAGARKLTGVSAGTLSAASTDAVNGSQLFATNQNVTKNATDITALGGRVTTTEGNVSNLQTTVNNISTGSVGLVKQDATTRTVTVAKDTDGTLVDLTGTAGARKLTGVSAGTLSAASTDAVNGSQLNTTNQNVTALGGRVTTAEGNISNIKTDVTNIGGRVTTVEGNVSSLQTTVNNINSGTAGLVQQTAAGANLTVGKATDGAAVDFTGTAGTRKLTGVSAGTLSTASTDAVNGSQLFATNQSVTKNATDITALGGRVTTTEGNVSNLQTTVNNISTGSVGLVKQDATTRTVTVAKDTDGTLVDLTGTAGARKLTGVSAGTLSATSTEAVNGSQLNTTNQNLTALGGRVTTAEGNITNVTGRVTTVEGNVSNLQTTVNNISTGSAGLVKQDATTRTITVAKDTDGTLVDLTGTAGARKLTGVSAGTLSATSTDAVNGSQLNTTNQNVTALGGRVTSNEGDIATIKTDVAKSQGDITGLQTTINNISGGSVGLVQQDATTRAISVAKDSDGALVDFTGTAGARKLTGVSAGTLSATSTDAVNGSQLNTTNQNVATNASNITALGGRVTTAEGNITNVTGRVTTVEGNVSNLQTTVNNISTGSAGLVKQDATTRTVTVAKDTDGTLVDLTGTAGARKLTGVSAGTLSATSTDAVNGSQLFATNQNVTKNATDITALGGRVTTNEGDISTIKTDVAASKGDISNIKTDVTNIGGRVTTVEGSVSNLQTTVNNISTGSVGLVQQDATTRTVTVAKDTDGTLVDLTGTAGARKLTGVSAGTLSAASTDAVNGSQLFATNQNVTKNATDITALGGRVTTNEGDISTIKTDVAKSQGDITGLQTTINNISTGSVGLVQQDATTRAISVAKDTDGTLVDLTGTAGARKLTGVSAGTLSAASTDAVNGSQLNTTNQNVTALGGRVTTAEGNISNIKTDVTNIGGRVTTVEGNVSSLQTTVNNISTGSVGLVQQDATTRTVTVAKDTDGTLVDLTGTAGARKLTGVSAGTLSAASTDAVNGSQLFATNQNVTKNATDITALGGRVTTNEGDISTIKTDVAANKGDIATIKTDVAANTGDISNIKTDVTNIGGRVTTVEGNVSNLQTTVNNISTGSVGLVQQDATTRTVTVAKDTDGTLVDLTGTAGTRKLTGVSAGTLSATSTDAVNGTQLFTTNQNVTKNATDITALGGRVTTNEGDISTIKTDVAANKGDISAIKTDVAANTGDIATIKTDVAANTGDISTIKTDVAANKGDISNIKTDVTNIGGRVTTVEGNVSNLQTTVNNISTGSVGLVQQDATTRTVTVAKDTDGTLVDLTGTAGARKLTGVSAGTLSATSTDAVNGSQLFTTNQNVTKNATDITALGGRVTTNEGDISTIKTDVAANKGDIATIKTDVAANTGDIATIKTDVAANTGDISTIKTDVAASKGDISNIKTDVTNIKTDVTNIGGRVTTVEGSVSSLQTTVNNISTGSVGLVQQDATTRTVTVAKDSDGALVNFTGTAGARKLTGVSAGDLSATSLDAVNGSQLFTTNQNVTKNATDITALGGRVTANEGDITTIKTDVAANKGDISSIKTDVAANTGDISTIKTDVAASKGDISNIKTDVTNIGAHVTTVEGNVSSLQTTINNISTGSVGLVQQDATTRTISVAKDSDGALVNFTGTAGARKLTGVSAGDLSAASLDAVNGSQLFATNQNVTRNTTDITALGGRVTANEGDISTIRTDVANSLGSISNIKTDVTNIGGRVTTVEGNVSNLYTQLNSGSVGLVQQKAAGGNLTVGAGVDGNAIDFANNAGRARKLTRVAAGTSAEDAVNVAQLKSFADDMGGGASIDPITGLVTAPSYTMTNADGSQSQARTVGDAVTNLDSRVYSLTSQMSSGGVGLVQQAGAGQKLTIGKGADGNEVSFNNAAGDARKLSGVAAGAVSATSTDAMNGSQLHAASQSMTTALGGGSAVNADGTISAPTYTVTNANGTTAKVSGVEGAIGNLDSRVHANTARIDNVESSVSSLSSKIDGAVGLVQQAAPGEQLTVGKTKDGTAVNFNGTAGDRTLTGVAAGKADNDAANIGQLKAAGVIGAKGEVKPVLGYDSADKSSVTLGDAGSAKPVTIHNVASGVSDNDAVNVSQLNARLQAQTSAVLSQANGYTDDRFKSALNEIDTLRSDVDDRFHVQDARIDRMGAMSTAMASMTSSMSGVARDNRVGVGAGESNGRLAMAVGYQRAFRNGGATLTAGASFTDEDSSVGIGGGFGW